MSTSQQRNDPGFSGCFSYSTKAIKPIVKDIDIIAGYWKASRASVIRSALTRFVNAWLSVCSNCHNKFVPMDDETVCEQCWNSPIRSVQ